LEAVQQIIDERRDYWPLSVRGNHYGAVEFPEPILVHAGKPDSLYRNTHKFYRAMGDVCARGRIEGHIPYEAIGDETRPCETWPFAFDSPGAFMRQELAQLFTGYWRRLLQSQANHVEIVGEKLTILSVIQRVAAQFVIPYTIGRGYNSLTKMHDIAVRFKESGKDNLVLIYTSDFDPEGEDMVNSAVNVLCDDLGVDFGRIRPVKAGLTHEQTAGLTAVGKGMEQNKAKKDSSRYQEFVERYGEAVYELEAVPLPRLERMLADTVRSEIDVKAFNHEVETQKADLAFLEAERERLLGLMRGPT
jgi:hypothetical protein